MADESLRADTLAERRPIVTVRAPSNLPFELFVALRYLLARRKQAFISLISAVSTLGVAVGVAAMVFVGVGATVLVAVGVGV